MVCLRKGLDGQLHRIETSARAHPGCRNDHVSGADNPFHLLSVHQMASTADFDDRLVTLDDMMGVLRVEAERFLNLMLKEDVPDSALYEPV